VFRFALRLRPVVRFAMRASARKKNAREVIAGVFFLRGGDA